MNRKSLQLHPRIREVREFLLRLARAREGVEAIEFAIVLPVLLLFLLGCIEFGRFYWTQSELQYAAEAAARCVTVACPTGITGAGTAVPITGTGPNTYAAVHVYGISVPAGTVFTTYPAGAGGPACGNLVIVCYPFQFLLPGLFPFTNTAPPACPAVADPTPSEPCCPAGYTQPTSGLTLHFAGCHQA